jgi:hypothetical protein
MIDAIWLLGSRAMLDYTRTATTWLLTRKRREGTEETMRTATNENKLPTTVHRIGYAITGLVFALIIWPLFVIGTYTILTSLIYI